MAVMRQTLLRVDPRYFQIAALGALLFYGCTRLGFEIDALQITLTLTTAVAAQLLLASLTRINSALDVRSPLITGLSLCLLLRTNNDCGKWIARIKATHLGSSVDQTALFGLPVERMDSSASANGYGMKKFRTT